MLKSLKLLMKYTHAAIFFFFFIYFAVGIGIYRDYGVSWDEPFTRTSGVIAYDYVRGLGGEIETWMDRNYGTAYQLPVVFIEDILNVDLPREILLMRHFINFLFYFFGVVFFYALLGLRYNWKYSLLGTLFLIISPRIFADSFYNPKDIPFLVAYIVAIYTQIRFLQEVSSKWAVIHSTAAAFLIDNRVAGIIVPITTVFFVLANHFLISRTDRKLKDVLVNTLIFLGLAALQVVVYWPYLWEDPVNRFRDAFYEMSNFTRGPQLTLYMGKYLGFGQIPWHYIPVWIGITTPPLYLILFGIGLFSMIFEIRTGFFRFYRSHWIEILLFVWLFGPILSTIVFKSYLYDGWRHLYFVYPAFVAFCIFGLKKVNCFIKESHWSFYLRPIWSVFLIINIIVTLIFMVRYHPYQNLYFNTIAGSMDKVKERFEMDYWGLTFREGLEHVAKTDTNKVINVYFALGTVGQIDMLQEEDRVRFVGIERDEDIPRADYILSNYRGHHWDYDEAIMNKEIYRVRVGNATVMSVFKMK